MTAANGETWRALPEFPDYAPAMTTMLRVYGCQRVHHLGDGIWLWYSPLLNRTFVVESFYPSLVAANAVLDIAGISVRLSVHTPATKFRRRA